MPFMPVKLKTTVRRDARTETKNKDLRKATKQRYLR